VKQIKAVIFDLDGTLVRYHGVEFESSWGAIAAAIGKHEESTRLLSLYLEQHDAYEQWVAADAALLAGIPVSRVAKRVFPPPYAKGVLEAIARLRGAYCLGILSSGVDLVAERVCKDLGLEFAVANRLLIEDEHFTGGSETIVDLWKKAEVMREIAAERGLSLSEICYVGDHMNDVPVMEIVGLGIAFNPKDDELERVADHVTRDFAEIPELIATFERKESSI
jgi:phosphoserine phosphatase